MNRREYARLAGTVGFGLLGGCLRVTGGDGGGTATPSDADGDGVPDASDYAPRDPEVQAKSDLGAAGDGDARTDGDERAAETDGEWVEPTEDRGALRLTGGEATFRLSAAADWKTPEYVSGIDRGGDAVGAGSRALPIALGGGDHEYFNYASGAAVETRSTTRSDGTDVSAVRVRGRYEALDSALDVTATTQVHGDEPIAITRLRTENAGDGDVRIETPGHFIADGISVGEAELADPGRNYRFFVSGSESRSLRETGYWRDFPVADPPFVSAFDGGAAVTVGLLGGETDVEEAMTDRRDGEATRIKLLVGPVALSRGESAAWTVATALHDGGEAAPERAKRLVGRADEIRVEL